MAEKTIAQQATELFNELHHLAWCIDDSAEQFSRVLGDTPLVKNLYDIARAASEAAEKADKLGNQYVSQVVDSAGESQREIVKFIEALIHHIQSPQEAVQAPQGAHEA